MFETAELGRKLSKQDYEARLPDLRTRLLKAQARLETAGFSVVVLLNGVAGAGASETANVLNEWLDARYLYNEVWSKPTREERERPEYYRYFMWLPPAGRIGILLGSWYTEPIVKQVSERRASTSRFERALTRITAFERAITDDGTLIVKLWFHVSKREQKRRLARLGRDGHGFRVSELDRKRAKKYDEYRGICELAVRKTSTGHAPWMVIESADDRYRNVAAAERLLEAMEARLDGVRAATKLEPPQLIADPETILDSLDLSRRVEKEAYNRRMPVLQLRLSRLAEKLARRGRSAIIVFEGADAAGKGGAIRRITWALPAAQYRIIPVAAPNDEERAHHYLWRFWRHLPRRGRITIYDRSWYGRVLVERVEGFARPEEWSRAYKEINDFEEALTNHGIILVKFWLAVSAEEQLKRFRERENEPWKQHKITAEDYRNRAKSTLYEAAASEMIARNSTSYAPFHLIPANDKRSARLEVLELVCDNFERAL